MTRLYVYIMLAALINGVSGYLIFNNIFYAFMILVVFIGALTIITSIRVTLSKKREIITKQCYDFVSHIINFIEVNKKIEGCIESYRIRMNKKEKEIYSSVSDMSEIDKLKYLANYYQNGVYNLLVEQIEMGIGEQHYDFEAINALLLCEKESHKQITEVNNKSYNYFLLINVIGSVISSSIILIIRRYLPDIVYRLDYQLIMLTFYLLILTITVFIFTRQATLTIDKEREQYEH